MHASDNDCLMAIKSIPAADKAGVRQDSCCVKDRCGREMNPVAELSSDFDDLLVIDKCSTHEQLNTYRWEGKFCDVRPLQGDGGWDVLEACKLVREQAKAGSVDVAAANAIEARCLAVRCHISSPK